ncbi:Fgr41 GPI-anchored protein [Candida orthopsilosis Co 90-125]|uniref:Fgr41 GPI-anchored protein n=1 Tax=Candida orthopsilosis (strain 90-125) TaxID=1136231 RepID=H8WWR3_CANO9|nr:Fgr41 GPI-anchored protein [Candida orthopsilosis Co 90-125]CCG21053.1 Fgr41 GPI-anchored protein [Candida orthopsilosis Co 90-125]
MKFNKFLASLASFSLLTQTIAAPAKRGDGDDDDDVVVVTLQTTVSDVHTNTHIVNAPTSTYTNYIVSASTTTVTHYTATVTSTIWGTAHTYTTVATTPISAADVSPISENEVQSSTTEQQQQQQQQQQTSPSASSSTDAATAQQDTVNAATPSSSSGQATSSSTETSATPGAGSSTQLVQPSSTELFTEETADSSSDGPTITATDIPTSTDSWIIENVTTVTSDGVCYVNYDYYYDGETDAEETVTSTSTYYTTITAN